jgi:hypothetical protein
VIRYNYHEVEADSAEEAVLLVSGGDLTPEGCDEEVMSSYCNVEGEEESL